MASEFGKHLKARISREYRSLRAFVREAGEGTREDSAVGYLSKVIAGKKPPPLDRIDAWASALKLEGADLEHFLDLACLAHLPEVVRPRFERILSRLEAQEKQRR